ncbi:adenylate/guanylate cyclase domain-containing protein [Acidovorax sp. NCPPB 4044]|uniref:adenylate/guanylate cyclase domain-containing protein n=1 Tax=Acidovorax sp. NCPPB 4044 TaxID=2940490 RepID=UPI002302C452|nr:adenylate/guanylate cyclase domain-containing protein [Acidovorax sp. NCPPB 4044]MDA8523520.1 adenylate/guanylate cyclase domain-containing protein [Acidovorax sp. NCPPB 4044]
MPPPLFTTLRARLLRARPPAPRRPGPAAGGGPAEPRPFGGLPSARNLRWASGLTLWAYVALHLATHAAGLVSLQAAEATRRAVHAAWGTGAGTALLYGAFAVHLAMAGVALWRRHTWRMPAVEALRIALGLLLPLLLVAHVVGTRWLGSTWGVEPSYLRIVRAIWSPEGFARQTLLLTLAWVHGCLGLHLAMRHRAAWRRHQPLLLAGAVLLPVLALLGALSMGREIAWTAQALRAPAPPRPAGEAARTLTEGLQIGWLLALAALVGARLAWGALRLRRGEGYVTLHYPQRTVQVPPGTSVLEASRLHGIAHLSMCGGRARCSTCRVRVEAQDGHLPPPQGDERRTLRRVNAPADVRLACQLRPGGSVRVVPLFQPGATPAAARLGGERQVAVLFVDLRRWSGLAERQWPFDLAWVLDQYFERVGQAVREAGGLPNQFIGDSVMALFGLESDLPTACRQALRAAALIEERMDAWTGAFHAQFDQALDFGMGLHAGAVAVGQVGFEDTTTFTAVGEVVNTASRLQDYSKVAGARLVLSLDVARSAGAQDALGTPERIAVRGRSQPLPVLHVARPSALWGGAAR